ncbi:MAG: hypothetical protein D6732_10595 [Methanobacteriota archaeon]|nr:MAG: hypothetical protein D6732_10595 [Euryarchaeota archaeon]
MVFYHDETLIYQNECRETKWGYNAQEAFSNIPNTKGCSWILSDFMSRFGVVPGTRVFRKIHHNSVKLTWKCPEFIQQTRNFIHAATCCFPNRKIYLVFDNSPVHHKALPGTFVPSAISRYHQHRSAKPPELSATYWLERASVPKKDWPRNLQEFRQFCRSNPHLFDRFKKSFLKSVIDGYPNVEMTFLPKCHPDLNPIEKLWSHVKYSTSSSRYQSATVLERRLDRVYQNIPGHKVSLWFKLAEERLHSS